MRPTATELTVWLFRAIARRQTNSGEVPPRGRRRYYNGKQLLIHSREVLEIGAHAEVWGICYQKDDKRVRGNDMLYRLALAVTAFEREGYSMEAACNLVVGQTEVMQKCGYTGSAKDLDSLRVRVIQYRKRCKKNGVVLDHDLHCMQEYWRWLHIADLRKTEWRREYLTELEQRVESIEAAIQLCGDGGLRASLVQLRAQHVVNLATELHDSGKYQEARKWYGLAIESYGNDGEMPNWLRGQCERCNAGEGRAHSPALIGSSVVPINSNS